MRAGLSLLVAITVLVLFAGDATAVTGIARFRETQISHHLQGEGAGRVEVWRTRVYTLKGKFVGTATMACIYTDEYTSVRQCSGTYQLPLGTLSIGGVITARSYYEILVHAGDRFYGGAHGTVIERRYTKDPPQSFVTFYLVRDT